MKKFLLALSLLLLTGTPALALEPPPTAATQAFAMDYDTGAVLYDKGADGKMPTSSMSKVLTSMVVFDAIKKGTISMDQELPVSQKAWSTQGSKTFVDINKPAKVSDLVRGMIIQSGNDACIVLAEGIAGSEDAFAELLNKKAAELGMKNSHFADANGLPNPDHYSTPRDLALMSRALISQYPGEYKIYSEKDFTYNNIKQGNRNPLLYSYPGADGVKTGHTDAGGYGVIGSAVMNGRRVIIVLNGMASMQERADESRKIMDWSLRSFKNVEIATKGTVYADAPVILGQAKTVPLTVAGNVKTTLPLTAVSDVKIQAVFAAPLKAPVLAGTQAGKLVVEIPNLPKQEIPLVTAAPVEENGVFARVLEKFMIRIVGTPEIFMTRGLLITLEGGEGAGKTTQARKLSEHLEAQGRKTVLTREPGGTPEAEKIRDLLVQREGGRWTPLAECTLFFAARQMHVEHLIKPALAKGTVVICDRFTDSTRAYQGYGHGFDLEKIENLNALVLDGFAPDITLIFDLPVNVGLKRSLAHKNNSQGLESTEDKFERLDGNFHERMRRGYLQIAAKEPARCHVIDASKSPERVFSDIKAIVDRTLSYVV